MVNIHYKRLFGILMALVLLWSLPRISAVAQSSQPEKITSIPQQQSQNVELVGQIGGPSYAVAIQNNYAYVGVGPSLVILNISNPNTPTKVSSYVTPGIIQDIALGGSYVYIADSIGGLRVIDVSNPMTPTEVGIYNVTGDVRSVTVVGEYAYVIEWTVGLYALWVIDISDPTTLIVVGGFNTRAPAFGVAISGDYAYIAGNIRGLLVVNVADPTNPIEIGYYDTPGYAVDVAVNGVYAYVADWGSGLRVIDISNLATPIEVGAYDTQLVSSVVLADNIAYLATYGGGLRVIDIADPATPTEVGFFDTAGYALKAAVAGAYSYIADDSNGLRVVSISDPTAPFEVGSYNTLGIAVSLALTGNYAYVADRDNGLQVVNISNPTAPIKIGVLERPTSNEAPINVSGVAVANNYAYLAISSNGPPNGLQVIDVSNPTSPTQVSLFNAPDGVAGGVTVINNYAYLTDNVGLKVINVSNPISPTQVGTYPTHDARDVIVNGNYAYIVSGRSGLRVVNIANPATPTEVGSYNTITQDYATGIAVVGNYAYIAKNYEGLRIIDITNPATPTEVGFTSGWRASSVTVTGRYAYVSGNGSLRVIDISNPSSPIQVGFYDTPGNVGAGASIKVAGDYIYVADGEGGLTILRFIPKPPIILLPGIMGSRLTNIPASSPQCVIRPSGEIWPNLAGLLIAGYNRSLSTLYLDNPGTNPLNSCDIIVPTTVFTSATSYFDFYGNFATVMTNDGYQVVPFAYDWRLGLDQNANRLDTLVDSLSMPKVILVGHSMGGMLARTYIANDNRATKVATVITVGTPYWGAPKASKVMRDGSLDFPLNLDPHTSVIKQIMRNSLGAMELLPSARYISYNGGYLLDESGNLLSSYNATFNYFVAKGQNGALLSQADNFHSNLDSLPITLPANVNYYALRARNWPTPNLIWEHPCWSMQTCVEIKGYAQGDGTVPYFSAGLGRNGEFAGGAKVCTFSQLDHKHDQLLTNDLVIEDIKRILRGESTTCTSVGQTLQVHSSQVALEPLVQVSVWGDVKVRMQDATGNQAYTTSEGWIVNSIPSSTFDPSSSGTSIVLPSVGVYTLTVESQSNTSIKLYVTDFRVVSADSDFNPNQRAVFLDVPLVISGTATMTLDFAAGLPSLQLRVDDALGTPIATLSPTIVLSQQQIQDTLSPSTTVIVQGAHDALGFYTGPITVSLLATDLGLGIYKTQYSIDAGQTWQNYTAPLEVVAEQISIIYARSADKAGNEEFPGVTQRLRPYAISLPLISR